MSETEYTQVKELTGDEIIFLQNRLYSFNIEATKLAFKGYISYAIRNNKGDVIAGIHGYVWGDCCKIETLWVSESERNNKHGSKLLLLCEEEAKRRSCNQVLLETYSFQAPRFYEKNGYRIAAEVSDYPGVGYTNVVMRKNLT